MLAAILIANITELSLKAQAVSVHLGEEVAEPRNRCICFVAQVIWLDGWRAGWGLQVCIPTTSTDDNEHTRGLGTPREGMSTSTRA